MSKSHVDREIEKLAIELYEEALRKDQYLDPAELAKKLIRELKRRFRDAERSVIDDLIESIAHSTMQAVDRARTRQDPQPSLVEDLDRAIPVGKSKRIARRFMRDPDWSAHLGLVRDNEDRVKVAAARERKRYKALRRYLATGVTTEKAIRMWQADHPDEVLS